MTSPEIPSPPNPPTISMQEAFDLLGLDKLTEIAKQSDILEPQKPAFVWLHNGRSAHHTDNGTAGSGLAYEYKLFQDIPLVSGTPRYCQKLGAKSIGYHNTDNGSGGHDIDRFDWRYPSSSTNDDDTPQTTPRIKWEAPDYSSRRYRINQEERYQVIEQFFGPPKTITEIKSRQKLFSSLIASPNLDKLVDLKNGAYDTIVGLNSLFSSDEWEDSFYGNLCDGKKRSRIVGDYWDTIGEYDVVASVDESVVLINHGLDTLDLLLTKIGVELNDTEYSNRLPTREVVEQYRTAISKIIAIDGTRAVTIIDRAQGEEQNAIETLQECITDLLYAVGVPLEIARLVRDDGWTAATFEEREPTSYQGAWNLARHKARQVRIDSPELTTPLTILSGPNTSGKSTTMETDMLLRLAAQTTGFVPAKSANIRPADAFVKLERTGTFASNDLSAFMHEIVTWKNAFTILGKTACACIYADESYSTTSPEEQANLQLATMNYLVRTFGAKVMLATHNGLLLDRAISLGSGILSSLYHPEAYVDALGNIKRTYKLLPGAGDSMSIEVAKARGFPSDVLTIAESYLGGIVPPTTEDDPSCYMPIIDFSPEERQVAMREVSGLDILFTHTADKLLDVFSAQDDFIEINFNSPISINLKFPENLALDVLDLMNIMSGSTQEDVTALIRDVCVLTPAEILERQRLFTSLINDGAYLTIAEVIPRLIAHDLASKALSLEAGKNFGGLNPFTNFEFFEEKSQKIALGEEPEKGIYLDELLSLFDVASAYLKLHEICADGTDHGALRREFSELEMSILKNASQDKPLPERHEQPTESDSTMPAWERALFEQVQRDDDGLNKLLIKLGLPRLQQVDPLALRNAMRESRRDNKNATPFIPLDEITIQHIKSLTQRTGEIAFIGKLGEQINFLTLNQRAPIELLETIGTFMGKHRDRYVSVASHLLTYRQTEKSLQVLNDILVSTDSVHLHQLSNALTLHHRERETFLRSGRSDLTTLEATMVNEPNPFAQLWQASKDRYVIPWHAKQLLKLHTLCHVAGGLDAQDYAMVNFNDSGKIHLENIFSPTADASSTIIRNPVAFGPERALALTGPNGSGKSFYQKHITEAILLPHAVGYAPAQSATMPLFQKIIFFDRITKDTDGQSSYEQEIENWKKIYGLVKKSTGPTLINIDEPFTTTSERYQEALIYAVITDMLKKGDRYLTVSTHNHTVINKLGKAITPYHFKYSIDEHLRLRRGFVLQPGHAPSHAEPMARTLGFPEDILGA